MWFLCADLLTWWMISTHSVPACKQNANRRSRKRIGATHMPVCALSSVFMVSYLCMCIYTCIHIRHARAGSAGPHQGEFRGLGLSDFNGLRNRAANVHTFVSCIHACSSVICIFSVFVAGCEVLSRLWRWKHGGTSVCMYVYIRIYACVYMCTCWFLCGRQGEKWLVLYMLFQVESMYVCMCFRVSSCVGAWLAIVRVCSIMMWVCM